MLNNSTKVETEPVTRLRVAVAASGGRGWRALAKAIGRPDATVRTAVCRGFAGFEATAYRIEALGFDYNTRILCPPETLRLRKRFKDEAGHDPYLLTKPDLLAFARRLRVNLSGTPRTIEAYRATLLAFAAVTSDLSKL